MASRLKIKIVTGTLDASSLLKVWEALAVVHDVEVFTFESSLQGVTTSLPVVAFPEIPEMPGFFRDIDRYLTGADLIVGIETSKLHSFQALRCARKLGVPFACVVHEYSPFVYEPFPNIRAVQVDIYQNASVFFATSRRAAQLLQLEGVDDQKICRIPQSEDTEKFSFAIEKREKFRRYVGVAEDAILITIKTNLDQIEPALTLLQGMRLAINRTSMAKRKRVRILVCGQGEAAGQLKYQVSDMGLGGLTMFLAQETQPFVGDLLCATDILVEPRWQSKAVPDRLPWHALSAASSGVRVVVVGGTIAEDWLAGLLVHRIDDFSPMDIAMEVAAELEAVAPDFGQRTAQSLLHCERLSPSVPATVIAERFKQFESHDERSVRRDHLNVFIHANQVPVTYSQARDVLVKCEELKEFAASCETETFAEVLRIRGDALAALARGDEAITAFEEALKANQMNYHAMRGLGFLAWHGHSHEDALSFFKRGLGINPNDYQCLVGVGLVYRRLKMFPESVYWLQKAIAIGGPNSTSLSLLVQACMENPEVPAALTALKAAREAVGDHPNLDTAINKLESHQ